MRLKLKPLNQAHAMLTVVETEVSNSFWSWPAQVFI